MHPQPSPCIPIYLCARTVCTVMIPPIRSGHPLSPPAGAPGAQGGDAHQRERRAGRRACSLQPPALYAEGKSDMCYRLLAAARTSSPLHPHPASAPLHPHSCIHTPASKVGVHDANDIPSLDCSLPLRATLLYENGAQAWLLYSIKVL